MSDLTGGWAKATEAGAEVAKEGLGLGRELGRFLAPAFRPLIGMAVDRFEVWRLERQVRLAARFKTFLQERGLQEPTRQLAPSFLLPFLEHATIEPDDDLQDVWAAMLVNAADADSGIETRTAYIRMLAEMTCFDVQLLSKIEVADRDETGPHRFAHFIMVAHVLGDEAAGREGLAPGLLPENASISLGNLVRLGCISPIVVEAGLYNGGVTLTSLGRAFIEACTRSAGDKR